MMKKILYAVVGTVVVGVGGVSAYVSSIDPNQFKPMLIEQVKEKTGQDLVISGDIEWQLFPTLGLKVGATALKNPQGFAQENFMQFELAQASVDLLPIFSKHISVGDISLNGAHIFMQTKKDGSSNLEALQDGVKAAQAQGAQAATTETEQAPATATQEQSTESGSALAALDGWDVTLAGLELSNASVLIQNDKDKSKTELEEFNFKLDRFALDQWTNISFDLKAQAAGMTVDAQGKSELNIASDFSKASLRGFEVAKVLTGDALPKKKMDVKVQGAFDFLVQEGVAQFTDMALEADNLKMTGTSSVTLATPLRVRFDFKTEDMDLDEFLNLNATSSTSKTSTAQASSASGETSTAKSTSSAKATTASALSKAEPNLSAIKSIDLAGSLAIPKIKMLNVITTDINTKVEIKSGIAKLKAFTAKLYDGTIASSASLNANPTYASYNATFDLDGVQIEKLLQDFTQKDDVRITGTTKADISLSGNGLSEYRTRMNSKGTFDLAFKNGSVYGANLPQIIYDADQIISGDKSLTDFTTPQSTDFTDFGSLTTTMKLGSGVLSTDNLLLDSQVLHVTGEGKTNIVSTALDFVTTMKVVGSLDGTSHDSKSIQDISKYSIPVQFSGTWAKPSYKIKTDELLKQVANEQLNEQVDKQLDKLNLSDETKEQAKDLLQGLKKLF